MTPERIAELRADDDRHARDDDDTVILRVCLYRDLLTLAERYAWLRDDPAMLTVRDRKGSVYQGEHLDAAIDAAMKGGEA